MKLVHKTTGKTRELHYPRLPQAIRAARKREHDDWNPYQVWEVEGVYYENGRLATTEFKKGYTEGLVKTLAKIEHDIKRRKKMKKGRHPNKRSGA